MYLVEKNVLIINDKNKVIFEHPIEKVIEFKDVLIVLIDDNIEVRNNVFALNYNGDILWRINDILKVKIPTGNTDVMKLNDTVLSVVSNIDIIFDIDINQNVLIEKKYLR